MSNDWVEGVHVEYDDEELSYTQLLDVFFKTQVPVKRSRQYGSFVFPHNDEQERCTHAWLDENRGRVCADGVSVDMIQVEPLSPFWKAENYHQRHTQKTVPRIAGIVPRIAGIVALALVGSDIWENVVPSEYLITTQVAVKGLLVLAIVFFAWERLIDTRYQSGTNLNIVDGG